MLGPLPGNTAHITSKDKKKYLLMQAKHHEWVWTAGTPLECSWAFVGPYTFLITVAIP